MAATVTYYVDSVVWNAVTYDCSAGGPLEVRIDHEGEPLHDRSGCDLYSTFLVIVNRMVRATLRLRTVKYAGALGVQSDMTITLKTKTGTVSISIPDMVLTSVRMGQARATPGDCELTWEHVSDDGTSNPIS
jgi:hypothetical protein